MDLTLISNGTCELCRFYFDEVYFISYLDAGVGGCHTGSIRTGWLCQECVDDAGLEEETEG